MSDSYRHFEATDPFGRVWTVEFQWQQTAISIRHADAVDVKWQLKSDDETLQRVVSLPLPLLLEISAKDGRPLTDPWCMKLASMYLRKMIDTWQDMDKTLVTLTRAELIETAAEVAAAETARREAALAAG